MLRPYDTVCVKRISPRARANGWRVNQRAPQLGDAGTIVDVIPGVDEPELYIVECSDSEGSTVWLGEFTAEEIELHEVKLT